MHVLAAIAFDAEDESVNLEYESRFGLCPSISFADCDRTVAIVRKTAADYTYPNAYDPAVLSSQGSLRGIKWSGISVDLEP